MKTQRLSDEPAVSLQEVSRSKNLKKRNRKRNARTKAATKTISACRTCASQNPPYRLSKHPAVIYISAVSRPNDVLDVQAVDHKPRTLIPAFRNVNDAEDSRSPMKASAPLRLFFFAIIFLLVRQFALAQGASTGDLHVSVKDPKGGVVTNANVTARDVAKGLERAGSSDGQGGYSVRQLAPGTYTVTVDAPGFAKAEATGVAITVGEMAELPVTVTSAGAKDMIEVICQPELVETARSSPTDAIGQRRIDNLPINGRNYINYPL